MLELLIDLILGSCWIWVKLVMDKALARGTVTGGEAVWKVQAEKEPQNSLK
jgi:hypothetical protein